MYKLLIEDMVKRKYAYNFEWLGFKIIQIPQDIMGMQQIIWKLKPDLIIETGIAYGGSLIFFASMLELIGKGEVVGIEINIYPENKKRILEHELSKRITILEGSSTDNKIVEKVKELANNKKNILLCLDSNHTHNHVLSELRSYSSLCDYIIVEDTGIEDLPNELIGNRPWRRGNSPKSAVYEFLNENKNFVIDKEIENKIMISGHPDGYLRRVK